MTNADAFKKLFEGLYASELWAMSEDEFLCWVNGDYTGEVMEYLLAQEPRLITETDFENADENGFIPVWCEVMGNTSDPFVIKDYWNCIPIDALETAKEDGCRYWTSKPSLKQMKETPWA